MPLIRDVRLSDFIAANRDAIVTGARSRVSMRGAPRPTHEELDRGIPLFVDQLADAVRTTDGSHAAMDAGAIRHGAELLRAGFTVAQVVQDYGDVCQAITQLAVEQDSQIGAGDFQRLNKCLDNAIAEAVSEYTRLRDHARGESTERLEEIAHGFRNHVAAAMLTHSVLREGRVGLGGSTATLLDRSLRDLESLTTQFLVEVRLRSGVLQRERINLRALLEELEAQAATRATARGQHLTVTLVPGSIEMDSDLLLLAGVLRGLLGNGIESTPKGGNVSLRTRIETGDVIFEMEDHRGRLPPGDPERVLARWLAPDSLHHRGPVELELIGRSVRMLGGELSLANAGAKGCLMTLRVRDCHPG